MSKKSLLLQPKQTKELGLRCLLWVRSAAAPPLKSVEVYQFTSVKLTRTLIICIFFRIWPSNFMAIKHCRSVFQAEFLWKRDWWLKLFYNTYKYAFILSSKDITEEINIPKRISIGKILFKKTREWFMWV